MNLESEGQRAPLKEITVRCDRCERNVSAILMPLFDKIEAQCSRCRGLIPEERIEERINEVIKTK